MATITTALTPTATRLAFIGPAPTIEQWETPIPQAEIAFIEQNAAVIISGVGDNQLISIVAALPRGFAYILAEANMNLNSADVDAWQDSARFRIKDAGSGPRWTVHQRFEASANVINNATSSFNKVYELVHTPVQKVIIGDLDAAPELVIQVMNLTTDQAAGTLDFFCRFLQFELNQAYHWAVNTPWPVR